MQNDWGKKALNHVRLITSATPGRGSATRMEAQAAEYVHNELSEQMTRDIYVQKFTGSRSIWFFLALVFGMAIMGHLAIALLPPAVGPWAAWLVSTSIFGFSFYLVWRKFTFRSYPFEKNLPRGPSQNIIGKISPSKEIRRTVVLIAHLDTHRAVIWFATDVLVKVYAILAPIILYGILAAPIIYVLAILSRLTVFGWLGLGIAVIQFIAWFTGVTADLGVYSPGANDNASAIGTVLSLAERLQNEPLQNTEVICLFTGCEETGCDGVKKYLAEYGDNLRNAIFLDFELVGIGEKLVYLEKEGVVRPLRISQPMKNLIEAVESPKIEPVSWGTVGAFTEMGTLWEYGYQGACLMMQRQDSNLLPEWHRVTDTPDKLSSTTLQKVHDFTWALFQKVDSDGA